jgi:hypothetical protein
VQISGNLNSALIDLYAAFAPNLSKHLLLITDTDYRKNLNSALDDAVEIAYNNNIALSVASPMPNRYSKFYYIERTGGVSVNYKGSFADEFCEVVENPTGRVEGSAEIILKGGVIAEADEYPNFTSPVTVTVDGIDGEIELTGELAALNFTLVYEQYTGQKLPAGVMALVPVFVIDPTIFLIDATRPPVIFVPNRRISEFGFRYKTGKIFPNIGLKVLDTGSVKKDSSPKGFKTLFASNISYTIGDNMFVYEQPHGSQNQTHFNTFVDDLPFSDYIFVTNGAGVGLVQNYTNQSRVNRVYAVDRRQKNTPDFYKNHDILENNRGENNPNTKYYTFPRSANKRNLSYEQMQTLVLNRVNDAPEIAPWEVVLDSDNFNAKKRKLTFEIFEVVDFTAEVYPWFAGENYTIEWEPRKKHDEEIVEIDYNYSDKKGTLEWNQYSATYRTPVKWNVISDSYEKRGPRGRFAVRVTGGPNIFRRAFDTGTTGLLAAAIGPVTPIDFAIALSNEAHNRNIGPFSNYINGQSLFPQRDIRMGLSGMLSSDPSFNACGWVATYNALLKKGTIKQPHEIIKYYDSSGGPLVAGYLGLNPLAISRYFNSLGLTTRMEYIPNRLDSRIKNSTVSVFAYAWYTPNGMIGGAHYVAIEYIESTKMYRVYNEGNHNPDCNEYDSIETWIASKGNTPIALITIK